MKNILTLIIAGISLQAFSQPEKVISTEIKSVTVYQQGAQVTRENNITIQKGKSTLIFNGLPSKITPSGIQVSATNDVMIISVTHSLDYLNKTIVNKDLASLNKKQRSLTDSIRVLNNLKNVYLEEKTMILGNSSIAGANGVNINELEQAATFFRKRLTEIETAVHKLENSVFNLKNELVSVSGQLLELNSKVDLPSGKVKVVVSSDIETKSNIKLVYFLPDAGWIPAYDIRIKDTDQPINLFYKAKLSQNTDEDWENVKLTLSTGNPSISNNKPELSSYFLTFDNFYKREPYSVTSENRLLNGVVKGNITDAETGEPLIGVNVIVVGTTIGAVSDINGNYSIEPPQEANTLKYSYIGYKYQEMPANKGIVNVKMSAEMLALQEVVVVGYGSDGNQSGSLSGRVGGVNVVRKKEQVPVAIEKQQLTTEFQIEIPYSIPSDNKPYDVNIVEYEIAADYEYYAVPKISNNAFLIAKIPEWMNYNLLSGNSYLFFKGIYQGESFMDLENAGDTLAISVGRDKDLVISREIQKDYINKSMTGSTKKEQKAFSIAVKNNKQIPVKISVEDQFPVSKTDEIKVDLIENSGATINEATGKLTWNLLLKPAEKKNIILRYSVRYPTGRIVIVE